MITRFAGALLDAVLPPLCQLCDDVVATPGICATCWSALAWIAPPICEACGTPFGLAESGGAAQRCVPCSRGGRQKVARLRAPLRYDPRSRELALRLKHADRLHVAPSLATWMAASGAELLAGADLVVPVPLHWTRLLWRHDNQAAVLARFVARHGPAPLIADLLVRRRRTPSQGELGPVARRRNVGGAFSVPRRHRHRLPGRRVLLVDDVVTTGATLDACAATLLRHGAAAVDALTLLRVVRPVAS